MKHILLGLLVPVLYLAGCASSQQTGVTVLIVDGCLVEIKGLSSSRAEEIIRSWDFGDDCSVDTATSYDQNEDG